MGKQVRNGVNYGLYDFYLTGVPADQEYTMFQWPLEEAGPEVVAPAYLSDTGRLCMHAGACQGTSGPYVMMALLSAPGLPHRIGITSKDKKYGAAVMVVPDPIIGCGWQAETQVASIRAAVPSINRVVAYCRTEKRLKAFCKKVGAEPGETHRDAGELDIVVTATTSKDPVLRGEWLRPGALVCAVGANDPSRRELDNVVLERASFVCCDSRQQSQLESGDLIEPVERGVLDWLEVHELHEVVSGELQGRADPEDIVLFKSNGIAAWDVAIGARAVELARERKVGLDVGAR
jgi:hypothetical protein